VPFWAPLEAQCRWHPQAIIGPEVPAPDAAVGVGVGTVAEDLEEVDLEEVEVVAASAEVEVVSAAEAHQEVGKKHGERSNFFFN
jgi:hypothetical protein